MRIAHSLQLFIAVLGFAAAVYPVQSYQHYNETDYETNNRSKRSLRKHRILHESWYDQYYKEEESIQEAGKLLTARQNLQLLREEMRTRSDVDCCPSVLEMIEPEGGKNQDDQYVELYRDGDYKQRFYELSCHKDVLHKPCRFIEKKLHNHSRCIQKYSYTYALVKDPYPGVGSGHPERPSGFPTFPSGGPEGNTWTLDYIRVRSGCSCVVQPSALHKRKRAKHHNRRQHSKHRTEDDNQFSSKLGTDTDR